MKMNILKMALLVLMLKVLSVEVHASAAPKSYIIAECSAPGYPNVKTQAELLFEGTLKPNGYPQEVEVQELVLQVYERQDTASVWTKTKNSELYLVQRDEDTMVQQFFMQKKITLQGAIATTQKGWDMEYSAGSMGLEVPSVFSVISTSAKSGVAPYSVLISMVTYSSQEKMLLRQSFQCKQFKPDGSVL